MAPRDPWAPAFAGETMWGLSGPFSYQLRCRITYWGHESCRESSCDLPFGFPKAIYETGSVNLPFPVTIKIRTNLHRISMAFALSHFIKSHAIPVIH